MYKEEFNMEGYYVAAYLDERCTAPMYGMNTKDFEKVKDFIWRYCQQGYNCKFYDYESETYGGGIAYAKLFNESTVDVDELIEYFSFM
jgi:hypothetical protein